VFVIIRDLTEINSLQSEKLQELAHTFANSLSLTHTHTHTHTHTQAEIKRMSTH